MDFEGFVSYSMLVLFWYVMEMNREFRLDFRKVN